MWDLGLFLFLLNFISPKYCESCNKSMDEEEIYITLKRYGGEEIYYCSRDCSLSAIFNTCQT